MVKIKKKIKEKIIFALKDLEKKSLNLTSEGNVSLRIQNGFIISPSGIIPEKISPEDIVFIDLNGKIFGKSKPSSEWKMHLLIYQKKKELKQLFTVIPLGHQLYHVQEKKFLFFIIW